MRTLQELLYYVKRSFKLLAKLFPFNLTAESSSSLYRYPRIFLGTNLMSSYSIINLRQFNWIKLRRSWGKSFANYFIWLKDGKLRLPMRRRRKFFASSLLGSLSSILFYEVCFVFICIISKDTLFSWHTWRCKCVNKEGKMKSALVEICILIKDCDSKDEKVLRVYALLSGAFKAFVITFDAFVCSKVDNDVKASEKVAD